MPCYTKIATKLIDLADIQAAAKILGIEVKKRTNNSYTLIKGGERITIEREREGEAFYVTPFTGSNGFEEHILKPLTVGYTKEKVKTYYKSKGYSVTAGQKSNEMIFTKYS